MIATVDIAGTPVDATASRAYASAVERLYADAAASFAAGTEVVTDAASNDQRTAGHRTSAASVADPEVIADLADAPELRAAEELRAWLHLSYDDVARVAGLSGRSVLHHWRQRHRTGTAVRPRASTIERLWRVHALVRAIAETLEGAAQNNATRLWFRRAEAGITPLELLAAGDVEEVERRARRLLMDSKARVTPSWRLVGLEGRDEPEPTTAPPKLDFQDSDFA